MNYNDMTQDLNNLPSHTQYYELRSNLQSFLDDENLTVPHITKGEQTIVLHTTYHIELVLLIILVKRKYGEKQGRYRYNGASASGEPSYQGAAAGDQSGSQQVINDNRGAKFDATASTRGCIAHKSDPAGCSCQLRCLRNDEIGDVVTCKFHLGHLPKQIENSLLRFYYFLQHV